MGNMGSTRKTWYIVLHSNLHLSYLRSVKKPLYIYGTRISGFIVARSARLSVKLSHDTPLLLILPSRASLYGVLNCLFSITSSW